MTSRILYQKEIEKATIRIECGNKSGTAFFIFVSSENQILLTCEHNLSVGQPIKLYIGNNEYTTAEVVERIVEKDIAILATKLDTIDDISALPLKSIQVSYNEHWETYGFPTQRINSLGRYNGTVSRINEGTKWDIDLECEQYFSMDLFDGLSGSALIIDGYVIGVIGYDNIGTLGATSIHSIAECLVKHGIIFASKKIHSIPESIEEDIVNTTPNNEALDKINKVIIDQIVSSYFLVTGSPGSGKTTIAAQLELKNANHIIIDRFFVKVPENEEYPTQIRATPEFFLRWIEEVCYRALYNSPPPRPKSDTTLSDRILTIYHVIQRLSNQSQQQDKIVFLIVDGLDDVSKSKIEDYLAVLPQQLPPNFKIIFFCTSREVLPGSIQGVIKAASEIQVTPLSIDSTEMFISAQLKDKQLSSIQISELAQKSEGHPLYIRYLIKYILETEDLVTIDNWIDSIPTISGEIENYYHKIWQQLDGQTDAIWLAATLARLRIPIEKGVLLELLPKPNKHNFIINFSKIQHLLRDKDLISIYHTSFSDFINKKTTDIDDQVHAYIADFTLNYPKTYFGISERVYHLAHGDEQRKRTAIEECNQSWVDDCALNSINPDIVLADIKYIVSLAADLGIAYKVISLLLLSQRVNYRYNTLFRDNAIFLVDALLSLNKPEEAIRYVIRNKTLIADDEDALYLLQKFYEYDANEEAEVLLDTINLTCRNIVEGGFDTDSFNRFVKLRFAAVTLSSNSDFKNAAHELMHLKNIAINLIQENGNSEEALHEFKDNIGSFNSGYYIWRFNIPPITKAMEDKFTFDNRSSGFIALSIYHALDFQEKSPKRKIIDNIPAWIEDLEYTIDRYGMHANYHLILLSILLGRSKRVDIIEKLYLAVYRNRINLNFRKENGVDMDYQSTYRFMLYVECQGFFDTTNELPALPKHWFSTDDWEENIQIIIRYLSFLNGKIKRYQVDGKSDAIKSFEINLNNLLEKLTSDLRYRIHWKRSYALPESIYPCIYKQLIELLLRAFPSLIQAFCDSIVQKKYYQLGLYTEGYINSLFTIVQELLKNPEHDLSAFKIIKVLEEHIITTVENRWERNEYLLRLIELYGRLKNEEKANHIFKEMIDTSMGPSWYKEAQLGIINTTVSNIIPQNGDDSYLQKFAAHLHSASGEMTFQRYVKQQQEDFVGDLAKIGSLDKSISYFKYLLLPDYKTVIDNAESGKVDMPHTGGGYLLGARAIEEQSGILDMLRNLDCKGSLIALGLSELFILGDDRYLGEYARVQTRILNYIESNEPEKLDLITRRLCRFVVSELSDEYRNEYLHSLFSDLSPSNFDRIRTCFHSNDINILLSKDGSSPTTGKISSQGKEEESSLDKLVKAKEQAQRKLHLENKSGARKIIIKALEEVQNEKYGVWSSNYSNKINDVRRLLSESYNNSSELIQDLKNLIINEPYFEEWIIAKEIIDLLRNIDNEHEKQTILSSVLEHIELMVRTSQSYYDRYSWMNCRSEKISPTQYDKILLELLIWFLNHPILIIKNRTIEILAWLGSVMPEITIRALINEIISEGYKISRELSASIIHQIANLNPTGFSEILQDIVEQHEPELLEVNHFMIKSALLDAFKELKSHGRTSFDNLIGKLEQTFIASTKRNGDIVIEEGYLQAIDNYLYKLNELGILNKEFAESLLGQIEKIAPLPIQECQKASAYIDRSFNDNNDIALVSDFDSLLRYALNIAIVSCVTIKDKEKVADILRFYQPTFPENKLQAQLNPSGEQFEAAIKDIFESGKLDFEKLLINNEFPLNYFSTKHAESRTNLNEIIDLTSFLIPLDKYSKEVHSFPEPTFSSNNNPDATSYEEDEIIVPLFVKCEYLDNVTGSDLVPAVINYNVNSFIPGITNSIASTYWRRGRNWNNRMQGVAQQTGYFTTVSKDLFDALEANYKLIWQICFGYDCKYIDIFEQKELKI